MIPLTVVAHQAVQAALRAGDRTIDATAGNGGDTLVLAEAVGPTGHVLAIDCQAEALARTRQRLATDDLRPDADRFPATPRRAPVTLCCADHAAMMTLVPPEWLGTVGAVMFNLGYLPGSTSTVITGRETTVIALQAATRLLRPGGVITLLLYPGHPGGADEAEAVEAAVADLTVNGWRVVRHAAASPSPQAPRLLVLHTAASASAIRGV